MFKKMSTILVTLIIGLSLLPNMSNAQDLNIIVDGKSISYKNGAPFIDDSGNTMVPLRDLLVGLTVPNDNKHIIWDGNEQKVTIKKLDDTVTLTAGKNEIYKNDALFAKLEAPAKNVNGHVFLPARAIAEALGFKVNYEAGTNTVTINWDETNNDYPEESSIGEENPLFKVLQRNPQKVIFPKIGFMNKEGKVVIPFAPYFTIGEFKYGVAKVNFNQQKLGLMYKDGKTISTYDQMDMGGVFYEGLTPIRVNNLYGYMDTSGTIVIEPQFRETTYFHDGLAQVKKGNEAGYINKTGTIVIKIPNDVKRAYQFQNGMAQWIKADSKGKETVSGYINTSGELVIPFTEDPDRIRHNFSNGLAKEGRWIGNNIFIEQFIDKTGKVAFHKQFNQAGDFHEGLAAVEIDGKIGFINRNGNVVIEPQFERSNIGELPYFSNGLAKVKIKGMYGFIDKKGSIVIEPKLEYQEAHIFQNGLSQVTFEGNYRYIDKTGKVIYSEYLPNLDPKNSLQDLLKMDSK